MKNGTELTVEITSIAYGGDGIARHEGRVIFVPFTIPGESVRVRVVKMRKDWARATVVEVVRSSPNRVSPPCPWFMRCGGCAYQHISYQRQLEIKAQQVSDVFRRIGKIESPNVEAVHASPLEYGYRNRITVHVVPPMIGFRGVNPQHVIDISKCLLAEDPVNAALQRLRGKRHLRAGTATLRSRPSGGGFRQVNDGAATVLASLVVETAQRGELVVDAYCGEGFLAKHVRERFQETIGIDWSEAAIDVAREGAMPTERYYAGDTADILPQVLKGRSDAVVILDPPAQGVAPAVIETLLEKRPSKILYISCDPATLARDIKSLGEAYKLQRAIPVDMFPQTASIETLSILERAT